MKMLLAKLLVAGALLSALLAVEARSPGDGAAADASSLESTLAHLQEADLEPEVTLKLLQAVRAASGSPTDKRVDAELVSVASQLLELVGSPAESNCSLTYFNHLGRLNRKGAEYPALSRLIDRARADQLLLCHQRNPRFSAYLAMNAAPHYLDF